MNIWIIPDWWIPSGNQEHLKFLPFKPAEKKIEFGEGRWDTNFKKINAGDIIALREGKSGFGSQPIILIMVCKVLVKDFDGKRYVIHLKSIKDFAYTAHGNTQNFENKFIELLKESELSNLILEKLTPTPVV